MTPNLSPSYDNKITRKYSSKTLEHKLDNKTALQAELSWPEEKRIPMIAVPSGVDEKTGGKLLLNLLPGLQAVGIELVILGRGGREFGEKMSQLAHEKGHRVAILKDDDVDQRKLYAAADIALFCFDAGNTEELQNCLRYGVVPIAPDTKALENYNPVQERGTAFLYDKMNEWHVFAALVRALETYKFPYDWRTIQRQCMESAE
ncbi:MAG TPA: hypothetical protein VI913_00375 [Candidatus Peribacteraceae bacterium]|nr:hypothetical protein [Candidatus Peribacteraceae bacterium]